MKYSQTQPSYLSYGLTLALSHVGLFFPHRIQSGLHTSAMEYEYELTDSGQQSLDMQERIGYRGCHGCACSHTVTCALIYQRSNGGTYEALLLSPSTP